jgi:hypothetical protein
MDVSSVCGVSLVRMVTGITGANNPDITWHYAVNLVWWYVCILPSRPCL